MTSSPHPRCPKCGSAAVTPVPNPMPLGDDNQPRQKAAQCECGAVFTYLEPSGGEDEASAHKR